MYKTHQIVICIGGWPFPLYGSLVPLMSHLHLYSMGSYHLELRCRSIIILLYLNLINIYTIKLKVRSLWWSLCYDLCDIDSLERNRLLSRKEETLHLNWIILLNRYLLVKRDPPYQIGALSHVIIERWNYYNYILFVCLFVCLFFAQYISATVFVICSFSFSSSAFFSFFFESLFFHITTLLNRDISKTTNILSGCVASFHHPHILVFNLSI